MEVIPLPKEGAVQQGLENVIQIILTLLSKGTIGLFGGQILSNICQTYGLVHLENNDGVQRTSYACLLPMDFFNSCMAENLNL